MKVAVLSGKGGTGKTFVSIHLALVAKPSVYVDCDVEEPNGHLFLKPLCTKSQNVTVKVPIISDSLCNGCRACVDFCKFNALAMVGNRPMLFQEICHSCGGCMLVCPTQAIYEKDRNIGEIFSWENRGVDCFSGRMSVGEASGVPIIQKLLDSVKNIKEDVWIDCPPGSACLAMESIKDADYCVLVAEPTLFGAHNLAMVYELASLWKKPIGVVLNKCNQEENPSENFCVEHHIPILGRIPFRYSIGKRISQGEIAMDQDDEMKDIFMQIHESIRSEVPQ